VSHGARLISRRHKSADADEDATTKHHDSESTTRSIARFEIEEVGLATPTSTLMPRLLLLKDTRRSFRYCEARSMRMRTTENVIEIDELV
jgi:hypothetical protein